jgi:DNA invertase Pin-like site-specific DNA recombinase
MSIAVYVRVSTQRQALAQTIEQQLARLRTTSKPTVGNCGMRTSSG